MTAGSPAARPKEIHALLPADLDQPTGGNAYDRRVLVGLVGAGWEVRRHLLPGPWPLPGRAGRAALAAALGSVPAGGTVLVDGLVGCGVPEVFVPASERVRLVVVVHLPLADETGLAPAVAARLAAAEAAVLRAAAAVVVTSPWAARQLGAYALGPGAVHVAAPGVDPAPVAHGSGGPRHSQPGELLCVAALTPRKDQVTLVRALARLPGLPWRATLAGPLDRDPAYAAAVRAEVARCGLAGRVRISGPLTGAALEDAYAAADLAVLVSRAETYGMVVTEALARGVPVVVSASGPLPETLGRAPDGTVPGLLVPPVDPAALSDALRGWLTDSGLRARLRSSAAARRSTLEGWDSTVARLAAVLAPGG